MQATSNAMSCASFKDKPMCHLTSPIYLLPIVIISCHSLVMLKIKVISLDEEYDMT